MKRRLAGPVDLLGKPDHPAVPSILIAVGYNKKGLIDRYRTLPFEPGQIIDRCGRKYVLCENGSQKRIS